MCSLAMDRAQERRQTANIIVGCAAASVVALVARRVHALSRAGALMAVPVGTVIFAGSGWRGSVALLVYFATSSLLGRLPTSNARKQQRGNERDAVQVLANGTVPAVLAWCMMHAEAPAQPPLMASFGGAIAAANADTWATEIGTRLGQWPRSIIGFRRVPAGTSGGVTLAGLAASAAGAAAIAAMLAVTRSRTGARSNIAVPVVLGGITGSLVDSILGATVQEVRFCDACQHEAEALIHDCGAPTRHLRGWRWCNNDAVNGMASLAGAAIASMLAAVMSARDAPTLAK